MKVPFVFLASYGHRPVLTAQSRRIGDTLGGASHVLTGSNFTGADGGGGNGVFYGADPATSFVVDNDGQITAIPPAQSATSSEDITVVTPGGTSNALAFEVWDPTVIAPTAFWDGGNFVAPGGASSWPTRSRAYATDLDFVSGGYPAPTVSSGCPLFVRASSTGIARTLDNLQTVLGNGDFSIAVRLSLTSASVQSNVDLLDGLLCDTQLFVGLMIKQTSGGAYEAWFLGYDGAERYVHATIALGVSDIIVKRESGVLKMTVNGGVTWVTGDALGSISGGQGTVLGRNVYAASHGGNGYFDGPVKALVINNAAISTADADRWSRWASAMHS